MSNIDYILKKKYHKYKTKYYNIRGGQVGTSLSSLPIVTLATCALDQWSLDFIGNLDRIIRSIKIAKNNGAKYRLGPELEICGYGCEDHFYEADILKHSWECLAKILDSDLTDGIICDIGMPISHYGVRYNCRVYCLNREIILIRPKMFLADDGNYRESRWFTGWSSEKIHILDRFKLPQDIKNIILEQRRKVTGKIQEDENIYVPFGVAILECNDCTIASETCEELFTPESPNVMLGLEGVDIITNGSSSYHQLNKINFRHSLITGATAKMGGVYVYSNQIGCDGGRLIFDGDACICTNGHFVNISEQLTFKEVDVITAKVNLDDVRTYRAGIVSRNIQAAEHKLIVPKIKVNFSLCEPNAIEYNSTVDFIPIPYEQQIGLAPARYLWDYLRRSGAKGFFIPLSGGIDSGSTALIVYLMCHYVKEFIDTNSKSDNEYDKKEAENMMNDLKKIIDNSGEKSLTEARYNEIKSDPKKICNRLLYTCNMPTKYNTGRIKLYAQGVADAIGSYHITAPINDAFNAEKNIAPNIIFYKDTEEVKNHDADWELGKYKSLPQFETYTYKGTEYKVDQYEIPTWVNNITLNESPQPAASIPRFKNKSGNWLEHLAIQNIQARLRMVTAYYMAQILPLYRYNEDYYFGKPNYESYKTEVDKILKQEVKEGQDPSDVNYEEFLPASYHAFHKEYLARANKVGYLLVLASSNADEAIRGFYTKYDASSGDINPIGSYSKKEIKDFLWYYANEKNNTNRNFEVYKYILTVTASPELTPEREEKGKKLIQSDEVDMEMRYDELYQYGLMRKRDALGPLSMFYFMLKQMKDRKDNSAGCIEVVNKSGRDPFGRVLSKFDIKDIKAIDVYNKIKTFYDYYCRNRNKMTSITPSIHATNYSPDDNRFDLRPYLYPYLKLQYDDMEQIAKELDKKGYFKQ